MPGQLCGSLCFPAAGCVPIRHGSNSLALAEVRRASLHLAIGRRLAAHDRFGSSATFLRPARNDRSRDDSGRGQNISGRWG